MTSRPACQAQAPHGASPWWARASRASRRRSSSRSLTRCNPAPRARSPAPLPLPALCRGQGPLPRPAPGRTPARGGSRRAHACLRDDVWGPKTTQTAVRVGCDAVRVGKDVWGPHPHGRDHSGSPRRPGLPGARTCLSPCTICAAPPPAPSRSRSPSAPTCAGTELSRHAQLRGHSLSVASACMQGGALDARAA